MRGKLITQNDVRPEYGYVNRDNYEYVVWFLGGGDI